MEGPQPPQPPPPAAEPPGASWSGYLLGAHDCGDVRSAKATYLSARHTRSLTLHAALTKLGVLPAHCHALNASAAWEEVAPAEQQQGQQLPSPGSSSSSSVRRWQPGQELRLTLAGADRNEGTSAEDTAVRFGELLRLCGRAGVQRVRLMLCGPGGLCACVRACTERRQPRTAGCTPSGGCRMHGAPPPMHACACCTGREQAWAG